MQHLTGGAHRTHCVEIGVEIATVEFLKCSVFTVVLAKPRVEVSEEIRRDS